MTIATDSAYPLAFGITLVCGGAITCGLGAFDPLLQFVTQPADGGEEKRARMVQKFNAYQNGLGVAMLVMGFAGMVLSAGYPDLASFSGLTGVANLYALAQVFVLPALVCMLATAACHHVSVYLPYTLLGALQGLSLYALSSISTDALAYSYFSVFYALFGVLPMFKFALSGELLRFSDGWMPLLGRLGSLMVTVAYMLCVWLFTFLHFNTESVGADTYQYFIPALSLGAFVALLLCGVALVYDRSGVESIGKLFERKRK